MYRAQKTPKRRVLHLWHITIQLYVTTTPSGWSFSYIHHLCICLVTLVADSVILQARENWSDEDHYARSNTDLDC